MPVSVQMPSSPSTRDDGWSDMGTAVARPVLMKGNEAMAEAAIQAGCDAYFGYPITPQAELLEWMARRMPELGRVFVQAESEVGAINMALVVIVFAILDRGRIISPAYGRARADQIAKLRAASARSPLSPGATD